MKVGQAAEDRLIVRAPMRGWVWPLSAVPDEAFAQGALGPGLALDPLEGLVRAPIDGAVVTLNASGHAVVLRHASGAEVLVHIGIDTVGMGGRGFEAMARVGDSVGIGAPLLRCDLDAVVDAGLSLVSPVVVVTPADARIVPLCAGGAVEAGAPLFAVALTEMAGGSAGAGLAVRREVTVGLAHGIHARPASALARIVREAGASGQMRKVGAPAEADAASVVALMALGVAHGDRVELVLTGVAATEAMALAEDLLAGNFAEAAPAALAGVNRLAGAGQLAGLAGSPGMAVGHAYRHRAATWRFAEDGEGAAMERARLSEALAAVDSDMAQAPPAGALGEIYAAHRELLADPVLRADAEARIAAGQSAGHAWQQSLAGMARVFARGDARLAERQADLIDVDRRVSAWLGAKGYGVSGGAPQATLPPKGAILLADDLLPSELAAMAEVAGVALAGSGPTAHVAIIAAGMGLPLLTALGAGLGQIADGDRLICDADAGLLTHEPDAAAWGAAEAIVARRHEALTAGRAAAAAPARTRDGVGVTVLANLGGVDEVAGALRNGAEGCGLLRSEFLFLDRAAAPDEEEQLAAYRQIMAGLDGRPLTIRTLDAGGDKPVRFIDLAREANPALGLRGIRIGLQWPELLDVQLRAVCRAAQEASGKVALMVPMIAGLDEWRAVRLAMERARAAVGQKRGGGPVLPLGLMIETPAAVLLADRFAADADFMSIGSNDLAQYILAMDRTSDTMAGRADALHPAVLRAIAQVAAAGRAANCPVSLCGGLAGDPLAIPLLVGMGVTRLSLAPALIPAAKQRIRAISQVECAKLAAEALAADSAVDVRNLVRAACTAEGEN